MRTLLCAAAGDLDDEEPGSAGLRPSLESRPGGKRGRGQRKTFDIRRSVESGLDTVGCARRTAERTILSMFGRPGLGPGVDGAVFVLEVLTTAPGTRSTPAASSLWRAPLSRRTSRSGTTCRGRLWGRASTIGSWPSPSSTTVRAVAQRSLWAGSLIQRDGTRPPISPSGTALHGRLWASGRATRSDRSAEVAPQESRQRIAGFLTTVFGRAVFFCLPEKRGKSSRRLDPALSRRLRRSRRVLHA